MYRRAGEIIVPALALLLASPLHAQPADQEPPKDAIVTESIRPSPAAVRRATVRAPLARPVERAPREAARGRPAPRAAAAQPGPTGYRVTEAAGGLRIEIVPGARAGLIASRAVRPSALVLQGLSIPLPDRAGAILSGFSGASFDPPRLFERVAALQSILDQDASRPLRLVVPPQTLRDGEPFTVAVVELRVDGLDTEATHPRLREYLLHRSGR